MSGGFSVFDKIQGVIVAIGTVAGGALIAFAPIEDLRAEIPYYFEIGLGFIGVGLLIFLAMFIVRAKSLILFILSSTFAAGSGLAAVEAGPTSPEFYIFGALAILIALFALSCLVAVFSGDDPAK